MPDLPVILKLEWQQIVDAPLIFISAVAAVFALAYKLVHWRHGRELDNKKSELDHKKTELEGIRATIVELERRIAESKTSVAVQVEHHGQSAVRSPQGDTPRSMWAGRIDVAFLLHQKELLILLKDGHSFFRDRFPALRQRLSDASKTTRVAMLHPDYKFIEAIASMDPHKASRPELQRQDCLGAIESMKKLREIILVESGRDIARSVTFVGHRQVPTWTGFIGDQRAFVHLYPTCPHRGNLPTLVAEYVDNPQDSFDSFDWYKGDLEELFRITQGLYPSDSDLWQFPV